MNLFFKRAKYKRKDRSHWIFKEDGLLYCQNCGCKALFSDKCNQCLTNFCPNCGYRLNYDGKLRTKFIKEI